MGKAFSYDTHEDETIFQFLLQLLQRTAHEPVRPLRRSAVLITRNHLLEGLRSLWSPKSGRSIESDTEQPVPVNKYPERGLEGYIRDISKHTAYLSD